MDTLEQVRYPKLCLSLHALIAIPVATPSFGQFNRLPVAARLKIFAYVYETVDVLDLKSIIQASGVQGSVTVILDVGGPNDQPLFVSTLFLTASLMVSYLSFSIHSPGFLT